MAYSRFADACHTPEEMADAEEALGTLAENIMKTMIETQDVKTIDMDGMKMVVQQTKAMEEMARTGETYHIPITIADETGAMSLRIVRGNGESGLIKMALYMESTGNISTTFRYEAGEVNTSVEFDKASVRELFESREQLIANTLKDETGYSFSFRFSQETGLSASDIYNWNIGNFETASENGKDNEIQTQALYSIARGYMNVIGELF